MYLSVFVGWGGVGGGYVLHANDARFIVNLHKDVYCVYGCCILIMCHLEHAFLRQTVVNISHST